MPAELVENQAPGRATHYSVYDLISSIMGAANPDVVQTNTSEYNDLLNAVRTKVAEEHANTLNSILTNPDAKSVLMPIILSYVTDYVNASNDVTINISRTAERIYQDMAGFGILTPYLNDPKVEEININAWNAIYAMWAGKSKLELLPETFSSSQECVDVIKKMVRIGGAHIDYAQPIIDSYIGHGVRISATLPPVNTEEVGATASIRKQTYSNVTREKYISMGFATEEVWDLIDMSITHGVSLGLAGSPGAGKTTLLTCLLKRYIEDSPGNNRVVTIEEAREIELSENEKTNPNGGLPRMVSPIIAWNTTMGEKPVTARMLVRHSLRVNPGILVPAEMRGGEAMEVVEAGQTGVNIISTFHALGAEDGYVRILSMCQMAANNASESGIMNQIIHAFPMMVYIKKDDDGVRRIHEIYEATGMEDGHFVGRMIFRFLRTKVEEDEDGKIIKIHGDFVQTESISKKLRRQLIQNGVKRADVDRYYFEGENPHHPERYEDATVEVVTVHTHDEEDEDAQYEPEEQPYLTPNAEETDGEALTSNDEGTPVEVSNHGYEPETDLAMGLDFGKDTSTPAPADTEEVSETEPENARGDTEPIFGSGRETPQASVAASEDGAGQEAEPAVDDPTATHSTFGSAPSPQAREEGTGGAAFESKANFVEEPAPAKQQRPRSFWSKGYKGGGHSR